MTTLRISVSACLPCPMLYAVKGCSRYVYFVRSHLQCETDNVVCGAVEATNRREKQLSSPAASGKKAESVASKPTSGLMQFEEQSSQFMSFLSSEQAKCE